MRLFAKEFLSRFDHSDMYAEYMNSSKFEPFERDLIEFFNLNVVLYILKEGTETDAKSWRSYGERLLADMLDEYSFFCEGVDNYFCYIYKCVKSGCIPNLEEFVYIVEVGYFMEKLRYNEIWHSHEILDKCLKSFSLPAETTIRYKIDHTIKYLMGIRFLLNRARIKFNHCILKIEKRIKEIEARDGFYQRKWDNLSRDYDTYWALRLDEKERKEQQEKEYLTNLLHKGYSGYFEDIFQAKATNRGMTSPSGKVPVEYWKGRPKLSTKDIPVVIVEAFAPTPTVPPSKKTLGESIRAKRVEQGLSQQALGRLLTTTQKRISRFEKDEALPKAWTLLRICAWLEVNPNKFMKLFPVTKSIIEKQFVDGAYIEKYRELCAKVGTDPVE